MSAKFLGTAGVLPENVLAPTDTPSPSAHLTRPTPLQSQTRHRLLHVIANQCAHWRGNPFSPQGSLASWLLFGQIRDALRIRLKRCFLPCTAAGVTDCPAASLLAMTCRGQRRFCVRKEVLPGESVTTFAFAPSTLFSLRLAELLTRPA